MYVYVSAVAGSASSNSRGSSIHVCVSVIADYVRSSRLRDACRAVIVCEPPNSLRGVVVVAVTVVHLSFSSGIFSVRQPRRGYIACNVDPHPRKP